LKINIGHVPEEGLNLQFSKDGDWFHNSLPENEKNELSLDKADVECTVRKLKETVIIAGSLETTITTTCSRCLEVTSFPLKGTFRYMLVPKDERANKDDQELNAEDVDLSFFEGEVIDMHALLYEQIMLQVPIRVLCRDDCRGLCRQCGVDLNTASCDCNTQLTEKKLAALKTFKKE
jgi:uncharacterized protein